MSSLCAVIWKLTFLGSWDKICRQKDCISWTSRWIVILLECPRMIMLRTIWNHVLRRCIIKLNLIIPSLIHKIFTHRPSAEAGFNHLLIVKRNRCLDYENFHKYVVKKGKSYSSWKLLMTWRWYLFIFNTLNRKSYKITSNNIYYKLIKSLAF